MSFLDWFSGLTGQMSADMAIDLGTANTLVAITGEGIVINEPSVVAIEKSTQRVLAVGHEAKNMINHTPDAFSAEHPLKDGVIADYDVTEAMISAFINKAAERKYPWQPKPRIVVCIPCGATSVEKRAVFEATIQAGARQAYLIEEPMAAAMGADLPVTEPTGSMVVDIGGGTTEVAVISLGGIVTSSSLRLAGNRLDEAIAMHLRDLLGIKIGERTAEVIKIKGIPGSPLPSRCPSDRARARARHDHLRPGRLHRAAQGGHHPVRGRARGASGPHRGDGAAHQGHLQEDQPRPGQRHHPERHPAHGRRRPALGPRPLPHRQA